MARTVGRILLITALAVACSACRVDVNVDVAMVPDGSGTITITAIADKAIVDQAPSLVTDLRLDDIRAGGWAVEGPAATPDGGLQIVLTQSFATPAQANAMLASLNGPTGPLVGLTLGRSRSDDATTYTLNGGVQLTGGLDAFTDPELLAAVGATPYAAQIAAAGVQPGDAFGFTLNASLPGSIKSTTSTATDGLSWTAPSDGTTVDIATVAESKDDKNVWAGPVSQGALIAMIAWCAVALGFIFYVIRVRRRRAAIRTLR